MRGVLSVSGSKGTLLTAVASPTRGQSFAPDALDNFTTVTTNGTGQSRAANRQNQHTAVGAMTSAYAKTAA